MTLFHQTPKSVDSAEPGKGTQAHPPAIPSAQGLRTEVFAESFHPAAQLLRSPLHTNISSRFPSICDILELYTVQFAEK